MKKLYGGLGLFTLSSSYFFPASLSRSKIVERKAIGLVLLEDFFYV